MAESNAIDAIADPAARFVPQAYVLWGNAGHALVLAAAEARMTLLIDGFIVTSALLVAQQVAPAVLDYCVFAHCSNEAGHRLQLDWLQAQPLLDIGLRLGEGTGAALALPLLNAACAFMNEMASFESAGVSKKS